MNSTATRATSHTCSPRRIRRRLSERSRLSRTTTAPAPAPSAFAIAWHPSICRARAIADGLAKGRVSNASEQKAHAYGVMAQALAVKDPVIARQLLASAFEQLTPPNPEM